MTTMIESQTSINHYAAGKFVIIGVRQARGVAMAQLTDPETLACYRSALANWKFRGFMVFSRIAEEWLRKYLKGMSQISFAHMLHEFVEDGGEIDQVVETRQEWSTYSHHYDLRPTVNGQVLYVETLLDSHNGPDPDDSIITVVNIHLA